MRDYILLFTLFICALTDIVTYKIKNWVLAISVSVLVIFDFFIYQDGNVEEDFITGGAVLFILIPFYLLGLLAAGDVKLLVLAAMYVGLQGFCQIAVMTVIASILIVIIIGKARHEALLKVKYPFAFALLLGAMPLWF